MIFTATKLRQNLYNILDGVIDSGIPVEIERKGVLLKIVPEKSTLPSNTDPVNMIGPSNTAPENSLFPKNLAFQKINPACSLISGKTNPLQSKSSSKTYLVLFSLSSSSIFSL